MLLDEYVTQGYKRGSGDFRQPFPLQMYSGEAQTHAAGCCAACSELLQLLVAAAALLTCVGLSFTAAEREALAPLPRTWGCPHFTVCSHGGRCHPTWKVRSVRAKLLSPELRARPECRPCATFVPCKRRVP